jgi:hypothetical protein
VFLKGILVMQGKFVQTSFSNMRLLRIKDAISAKLLPWARPFKVHARVQIGHSIHTSTNLLALVLDLTLVNLKLSILTQGSSSKAKAWPVQLILVKDVDPAGVRIIGITEAVKAAEAAKAVEAEAEAEGEHDERSEFLYHGNHACTQSVKA